MTGVVLIVLAYCVKHYDRRATLVGSGVLLWCTVIPLAMLIRDTPESQGYLPDGDIPEASDRAEDYENSLPAQRIATGQQEYTTGQALQSRSFWIASTLLGILFFGTSGIQVHQVPYFESIGFSTTEAAATSRTRRSRPPTSVTAPSPAPRHRWAFKRTSASTLPSSPM